METKTVNTELWRISPLQIHKNNQGSAWVKVIVNDESSEKAKMIAEVFGITKEETKCYAELIVQAVNACKQINPTNPINAAKVLSKIFEKLYELRDMIAIRDNNATLKTSAKFIEEMDSLFTNALN